MHNKYSSFIQFPLSLDNEFADDIFLQDYLSTYFPADCLKEIVSDLVRLGKRTVSQLLEWARDAELNEPKFIQFNACVKRIDEIKVTEVSNNLGKTAAEEDLVAVEYERKFGEFSRLYQKIKLPELLVEV